MSEKIYAFLLQLFPSHFRNAYGAEALQLFRDRSRDERGFLSGLRLWFDLLRDLVVSIPLAYRADSTAVVAPQLKASGDGAPSFRSLEVEAVSPRTLLYSGIVSLASYGCIAMLIGRGGHLLRGLASAPQQTPGSFERRVPDIDLSYTPADAVSGSVVHFTAKVSALGGSAPTGNVRFFDGITILSEGELDNGSTSVESRLPISRKHLLRATYLGDGKYSPASSVQPK